MKADLVERVAARRGVPWQRGARDPDAELVLAAQQDPARFVALYERYVDRIHDYVRVRVGARSAGEDVTSQVFMTALVHLGRFQVRDGGSFAAWLFRIAHNAVYDVQHSAAERHAAAPAFEALPDTAPGPEAQDRTAQLRRAIARLRPAQQHLLALRYGADLDLNEIAGLLGKSNGAVRVSLHRALRDLRRRYPDDD